jgi:hypothetical protein
MVKLKSRTGPVLRDLAVQAFILLLCSGIFIAIIIITLLTNWAERVSKEKRPLDEILRLGVSSTITIVSALQGILAAGASVVLARSFLCIQWSLIARQSGLRYHEHLALSPTTFDLGTLRLITSGGISFPARFWASAR